MTPTKPTAQEAVTDEHRRIAREWLSRYAFPLLDEIESLALLIAEAEDRGRQQERAQSARIVTALAGTLNEGRDD